MQTNLCEGLFDSTPVRVCSVDSTNIRKKVQSYVSLWEIYCIDKQISIQIRLLYGTNSEGSIWR